MNHAVQLLSIDECCQVVGLSRTRLYEEIGSGRLRSIKVGRRRLIPASAIQLWVAAQLEDQPGGLIGVVECDAGR